MDLVRAVDSDSKIFHVHVVNEIVVTVATSSLSSFWDTLLIHVDNVSILGMYSSHMHNR